MFRTLALVATLAFYAGPALADELSDQVRALYRPYEVQGAAPPAETGTLRAMASARLRALFDREAACNRRNQGICNLDFDVIVNGQDYEIRNVQVASPEVAGDKAGVVARFNNFAERYETRYEFVREGGAWKLDDIVAREPAKSRWRLTTLLSPKPGRR